MSTLTTIAVEFSLWIEGGEIHMYVNDDYDPCASYKLADLVTDQTLMYAIPPQPSARGVEYYADPDGDLLKLRDGLLEALTIVQNAISRDKPDHVCGARGFAESGDECPGCKA